LFALFVSFFSSDVSSVCDRARVVVVADERWCVCWRAFCLLVSAEERGCGAVVVRFPTRDAG
jgi:hypothetical protein